jgi:hypothetical protein
VLTEHLGGALLPVAALGQPDLAGAVLAGQHNINAPGGLDLLTARVPGLIGHGESPPATLDHMKAETYARVVDVLQFTGVLGGAAALAWWLVTHH